MVDNSASTLPALDCNSAGPTPTDGSSSPPSTPKQAKIILSDGMVSPGRKIQPQLRPLFGQLSRFIGLLAVASVWIKLCLVGSNEFFGEKATLDELMLGGRSADVDIGFGGDYLGWGEIDLDQQGGRGGSSVTLDFAELADIVEELVKVWNAAYDTFGISVDNLLLMSSSSSSGGSGGGSSSGNRPVNDGGSNDAHHQSSLYRQQLSDESSLLLGSDFDPTLFLNLGKWLADITSTAGGPRPLEVLSSMADPEDLLKKNKSKRWRHGWQQRRQQQSRGGGGGGSGGGRQQQQGFGIGHGIGHGIEAVSRWIRGVVPDNNHHHNQNIDRSSMMVKEKIRHVVRPPPPKGTTPKDTPQQQQQHLERKLLRPWTWLRKSSSSAAAAARGEGGDEGGGCARPSDMQDGGAAAAAVLEQVEDSQHHDEGGVRDTDEKEIEERKAVEMGNGNNNMSEEEAGRRSRVLQGLRADLVAQWPTIEEEAEAAGFPLDDAQLSRYLEVTFWQLTHPTKSGVTVADMVRETVSWRIKEGLGTILDATLDFSSDNNQRQEGDDDVDDTVNAQSSTSSSSSTPRNKRLVPGAKSRQVYVNGYDVDGHATVIYTPTNEATCSIDDCVLYLVYNLERALALGAAGKSPTKQKVTQYTFIVDLARSGSMPPLKTVKASFEVMGRHYPMRPAKVLLINGGSMIQWIWRVLEPLIEQRTRDKVRIVTPSEEAEVLGALFEPSQLERRFQGGLNEFEFQAEDYFNAYHRSSHLSRTTTMVDTSTMPNSNPAPPPLVPFPSGGAPPSTQTEANKLMCEGELDHLDVDHPIEKKNAETATRKSKGGKQHEEEKQKEQKHEKGGGSNGAARIAREDVESRPRERRRRGLERKGDNAGESGTTSPPQQQQPQQESDTAKTHEGPSSRAIRGELSNNASPGGGGATFS